VCVLCAFSSLLVIFCAFVGNFLDKKNKKFSFFLCHKSINQSPTREREVVHLENNITQNGAFSLSLSLSLALSLLFFHISSSSSSSSSSDVDDDDWKKKLIFFFFFFSFFLWCAKRRDDDDDDDG